MQIILVQCHGATGGNENTRSYSGMNHIHSDDKWLKPKHLHCAIHVWHERDRFIGGQLFGSMWEGGAEL